MRRSLLALLLLASFASCRHLTTDEDNSDPAIKARIEGVLRGRTDLDLKYVTIDVNNATATISGIVPTGEQMRLIRKLAAQVRGVDTVLNNLVIQE